MSSECPLGQVAVELISYILPIIFGLLVISIHRIKGVVQPSTNQTQGREWMAPTHGKKCWQLLQRRCPNLAERMLCCLQLQTTDVVSLLTPNFLDVEYLESLEENDHMVCSLGYQMGKNYAKNVG